MSLLAFFRRVLAEAQDERNPLLERVKFLSIVGSNLAEFFMVRVAELNHQVEAGVFELSSDGQTPSEQLLAIRQVVLELMRDARACLQQLLALLAEAAIHILGYQTLTDQQRTARHLDLFEQPAS